MLIVVEGIVMCFVLLIVCVVGIANGPVGLVLLYEKDVQGRVVELGLTTKEKIKKFLPKDGFIAMLRITEKQFSNIDFLLGYSDMDVLVDDSRVVEL